MDKNTRTHSKPKRNNSSNNNKKHSQFVMRDDVSRQNSITTSIVHGQKKAAGFSTSSVFVGKRWPCRHISQNKVNLSSGNVALLLINQLIRIRNSRITNRATFSPSAFAILKCSHSTNVGIYLTKCRNYLLNTVEESLRNCTNGLSSFHIQFSVKPKD